MNRHTTLSMLVTCALALPLATAAMANGSHNGSVSSKQTGKQTADKPVIPEYIQPGDPITANKLLGASVMSSDDKDIGSIHNVVMNKHGQITHLIVNTKDTVQGGNLIAIPWQLVKPTNAFVMNPGESPLRIIVTKDVAEGAPTIKGRDFPLPHAASSLKLSNHYFRSYFAGRNS